MDEATAGEEEGPDWTGHDGRGPQEQSRPWPDGQQGRGPEPYTAGWNVSRVILPADWLPKSPDAHSDLPTPRCRPWETWSQDLA